MLFAPPVLALRAPWPTLVFRLPAVNALSDREPTATSSLPVPSVTSVTSVRYPSEVFSSPSVRSPRARAPRARLR